MTKQQIKAQIEQTQAGSRLSGDMADHLAALAKAANPAAWAQHYPQPGKHEPDAALVAYYSNLLAQR